MAGGRRSQTATPTSKRKTRGQAAAEETTAEPDQAAEQQPATAAQSGAAQNSATENGASHANGAADSSAAAESGDRTSSQDRTYSEQVSRSLLQLASASAHTDGMRLMSVAQHVQHSCML